MSFPWALSRRAEKSAPVNAFSSVSASSTLFVNAARRLTCPMLCIRFHRLSGGEGVLGAVQGGVNAWTRQCLEVRARGRRSAVGVREGESWEPWRTPWMVNPSPSAHLPLEQGENPDEESD